LGLSTAESLEYALTAKRKAKAADKSVRPPTRGWNLIADSCL
jgi:hypothetical protein